LNLFLNSCADDNTPIESERSDPKVEDKVLALGFDSKTRPVLFFYSSTYCPGCGSWGSPTFKDLGEKFEKTTVSLNVHIKYADPYITKESNDIANNRTGQRFTPQIWVNTENTTILNGGRILSQQSIDKAISEIEDKANKNAKVKVANDFKFQDNKLLILEGIQMESDPVDELYLATYVIEDSLLFAQTGAAESPIFHNNVIRTSLSGSFGKRIIDKNHNEEYSILVDENWKTQNLSVLSIVWKKEESHFVIENAFTSKILTQ